MNSVPNLGARRLRWASALKPSLSSSSSSLRADHCSIWSKNNRRSHQRICWQYRTQTQRRYHKSIPICASLKVDEEEEEEEDYDAYYDDDDDVSDGESDGNRDGQPWKSLLELPARAAWRASDPYPPKAVLEAQMNVINAGGVTAKQLRKTYEGITSSHKALAGRRERERRRLVNNSHYSKRAQMKDEDILPVFYGRMETLANFRNRLAPNYAIAKRVLEECNSLLAYHNKKNTWKPKRLIDMGMGCGSASAAALEVFGNDIEWVHGIDPSKCMRECAQEFLEEIMEQKTDRITPPRLSLSGSISTDALSSTFDVALMTYTATELPHIGSTMAAAAILWEKLSKDGVFVMIEPGTPDGFNSIRAVRNMLLDCCPPHPRNLDGKSSDDGESEDYEEDGPRDQCHIIAPCTHNGKCPMERHQHNFFKNYKGQPTHQNIKDFEVDEDDWDERLEMGPGEGPREVTGGLVEETDFLNTGFCSFVQTMSSGSHLSKGEKFSYLVAQKRIPDDGDAAIQISSFHEDKLADLLSRVYEANRRPDKSNQSAGEQQKLNVQSLYEEALALEARYLNSAEDELGLELLQSDANRSSFGRIIRAPTKKRGHVFVDYCGAPGRLMRSRISKALDYGVAPGLYTVARKSRWGGFWPDVASQLDASNKDEK